jgi:hypothetical protein
MGRGSARYFSRGIPQFLAAGGSENAEGAPFFRAGDGKRHAPLIGGMSALTIFSAFIISVTWPAAMADPAGQMQHCPVSPAAGSSTPVPTCHRVPISRLAKPIVAGFCLPWSNPSFSIDGIRTPSFNNGSTFATKNAVNVSKNHGLSVVPESCILSHATDKGPK